MILSMGTGELAYRLSIGKPALNEDLVNIFDEPLGNDIPSTVEEQKEYYKAWLMSLRK